jgi:hypothetical protein
MVPDFSNPLNMIPNPYDGQSFILPDTFCTKERRLWFKRSNEILLFLIITELALNECKNKYEELLKQNRLKPDTPLKLEASDRSRSANMSTRIFLEQCGNNLNILARQVFVMLYGSLETYLFRLFERSFIEIGNTENIFDSSLNILMGKKWDGKFCKMRDVFAVDYKASNLISHFSGFEMYINRKAYKNPLDFMDELAQIRHKIVHASSILEKEKLIIINVKIFHAYYAFFSLLTDYVDTLFVNKFGYERVKINPAEA